MQTTIRSTYDLKMYLILNGSLGMTKGKMVAQASHACLKIFFDHMDYDNTVGLEGYRHVFITCMNDDMRAWKEGAFAKISLKAPDEGTMEFLVRQAERNGIATAEIRDNGVTQVEPGSLTAVAIGPFDTTRSEYEILMKGLYDLKLL